MKHMDKRLLGGFVAVALMLLSSQSYAQDAPAAGGAAAGSTAPGDYGYKFEDDPLAAGGFGPSDATIRVRPDRSARRSSGRAHPSCRRCSSRSRTSEGDGASAPSGAARINLLASDTPRRGAIIEVSMDSQGKAKVALTFALYQGEFSSSAGTRSRQDIVKVGKDPRSHLRVDDELASRMPRRHRGRVPGRHSRSSTWATKPGTLVNGQRVNKCKVRPGDQIQIGSTLIVLENAEPATAGATPQAASAVRRRPRSSLSRRPPFPPLRLARPLRRRPTRSLERILLLPRRDGGEPVCRFESVCLGAPPAAAAPYAGAPYAAASAAYVAQAMPLASTPGLASNRR